MSPAWILTILILAILAALATPRHIIAIQVNSANLRAAGEWSAHPEVAWQLECRVYVAHTAARDDVRRVLEREPNDARAWFLLGQLDWLEGHCGEAAMAWDRAILLDPNDHMARWLRARAGQVAADPGSWGRLLAAEEIADGAQHAGQWAEQVGDLDTASSWYEIAYSAVPSRALTEQLVRLYLAAGRTDKVIDSWQRLANSLPGEHEDHWWALGQAAELRRDWGAAVNAYERGAEVAAQPFQYRLRAGRAAVNAGDGVAAARWLELAYSERPTALEVLIGLGSAAVLRGDDDDAITWFRRAQEAAPTSELPPYNLGLIATRRGQLREAHAYFTEATRRSPQFVSAYYYQAQTSWALGQRVEALPQLSKAINLGATSKPWSWLVQLGDWQRDLGQRDEARASYQRALAWHPDDPAILARIEALR